MRQPHLYDRRYPMVVREVNGEQVLVPHVNPGVQVHCLCHEELQVPIPATDVVETEEQRTAAWDWVANMARKLGVLACDECREMFPFHCMKCMSGGGAEHKGNTLEHHTCVEYVFKAA